MSGGTARLGLVAALLVLGTGIGQVTVDSSREPPVATAPVVSAIAVCPDAPVTAGSAGTGAGTLRARVLDRPSVATPVTAAGQVVAGVDASIVAARGAVAGALAAERVTRVDGGPVRGLTAVRCGPATTSAWFVGGSTVVGESADLVLVNADDAPATVDVRAWSTSGPAEQRPGRGLAVPARSRVVVPLDRLAPDTELLALHVTTSRGRVAPYVRHARSDGRTPRGVDWVPATRPPARTVVVPGLPSGPGRRSVVLANPGPDDATAQVVLTTADGQLEPLVLDVPAGTTAVQEVSEQLADTPAAATVTSTEPVLAAGFVYDLQGGPVRELSWVPSAEPLTEPALLADVALSPPAEQLLLVTALDEDAVVDVVPVPVVGEDAPGPAQRLTVPAGTTAPLRLSTFAEPGATVRLAFEVRVVRGRPYASRYLRERGRTGPLSAVLPVVSGVSRVPRPDVVRVTD